MKLSLKIRFLSVCILLALLATATQATFAQANPLNFSNNFFVTGDYIVAGAYNMNQTFTTINGTSYTVGTITVPDANPGIQGAKQAPKGAEVVTALLYWQTVEMVGAKVGGPGSGQNAFFRPLLYKNSGGPAAPGYQVSGTNVGSTTAVTWSSGTCAGTSSNKITRTYRADVTGGLPNDGNGNPTPNGTFEVRLPSVGTPATPLTFGATLVVIYKLPTLPGQPKVPLNAIVIYDGAADPQGSMTQLLNGFYDADLTPISRVTYILGNGNSGRFETVYLSSDGNARVALPSLYGKQSPFPGYYGAWGWDNPTYQFTSANTNPIKADTAYATTQVVPSGSSPACVSSSAVILSTTVNNPDNDGILHSWKTDQGYCDAAINNGVCSHSLADPGWVDLTGARAGEQDVFLQYDYMCSNVTGLGSCHISTVNDPLTAAAPSGGTTTYTGTFSPTIPPNTTVGIDGFTKAVNNGKFVVVSGTSTTLTVNNPSGVAETNPGFAIYASPGDQSYSFDPRLAVDYEDASHATAVDKVVAAYANRGIILHANPGNAIEEYQANVSCSDSDPTCSFPNEPGTVAFRDNLIAIKNTNIETTTGVIGCDPTKSNTCVPVFQHGKKDSYHYALFSHGVGLPRWFLFDGSIKSVSQSGNTVTFTTSSPHGIGQIKQQTNYATATDNSCPLGRVSVVSALTNPNLNGAHCVLSNPAPTATTFSISVGGSPTKFNYTANMEPYLGVANGQVTTVSGISDVPGPNLVVSLGYGGWGPAYDPASDGNKWQSKAGTFMHELGHNMGLTHGGTFYNNLGSNPPDYTPTFEVNCKSNVQTSMSYMFQFDLLHKDGTFDLSGKPLRVVDYSEDSFAPTINESSSGGSGYLSSMFYANTASYQLTSFAGLVFPLTAAADASGGSTVYTGTITGGAGNALKGRFLTVAGFINAANNGTFVATASSATTLTLSNASGVAEAHAATASSSSVSLHCDGTPLLPTDQPMTYVPFSSISDFFWSDATGHDVNFNGKSTDIMDPHDEWTGTPAQGGGVGPSPGVDLQQVSPLGTVSTSGGAGGGHLGGGTGGGHLGGGTGGLGDLTHQQANSYARPAQDLTIVQEEASPRLIDLSWIGPTFGTVVQYNIYRSGDRGATFTNIASVPGTQTTYQDTVTCNLGGYEYRVTAVIKNDSGQLLESVPSNIVPASGQPLATGCYAPVAVTVQHSAVQGDVVPIMFTVTDDFFATPAAGWGSATLGNPVTNLAANTLVANGPVPGNCGTTGNTTILSKGSVQKTYPEDTSLFSLTNPLTGQFTFNSDTDGLCAGTYTFALTLDSGQHFTSSALQLAIDINDQDTLRITTLALPNGTVGVAYTDTLTEDGGTAPFTWTVSGLPTGISQQPAGSANLSGTTCLANTYNVNASVMDAKSNSGTQAFTLQINQANTTTSVSADSSPSVFQQMVTFTVTVTPQGSCGPPTGTVTLYDGVTQIGSGALSNGKATFPISNLSVAIHSITASYNGDANFKFSNSGVYSQTVNPAPTQIVVNSVLPSPAFVGQPITVSYTFSVQAPGAGSPIPPTGSIMVSASDGSGCVPQPPTSGMCTLSPAPGAAGAPTFTVNYSGDTNFVTSGANGNYTVYKLVFTTQPSNTGVGLTITPAVVVTAEDASNITLPSFSGNITLALTSGPGTLSGTTTQSAVSGVATFGDLSINKIANGDTLLASPSGGLPAATSNPFNIDTFYLDGSGNFGTLDLPTGTVTQIGPAATVAGATGIDLTPSLQVYTYASNQLMQITPSTGTATPVGSPGSIPASDPFTTGALTDGSYFGVDMVTGNLYSINLASGATMLVGSTSTTLVPAGCTVEASLTGSANVLYYTIGSTGVGAGCTAFPDTLYQINPADGTAAAAPVQVTIGIGGPGVNAFVGSTFVGGKLFGFTADKKEYAIDPTTGVATLPTNTTVPIIAAGSSQ